MFWERLYNMCLNKGCKPNTIAKSIGLSTATATKWKNGSIPNGEALSKIADYLDCSVDYLLGRTDNPNSHKSWYNLAVILLITAIYLFIANSSNCLRSIFSLLAFLTFSCNSSGACCLIFCFSIVCFRPFFISTYSRYFM